MHRNTKIATCCYCGLRARLVLDEGHHELMCRSCGAPLHDMKSLPVQSDGSKRKAQKHSRPIASRDDPHRHERSKKKPKKRKSAARWFLSEAVDILDDIFD